MTELYRDIPSPLPPKKKNAKQTGRIVVLQHIMAGFRLREARSMGDIGGNDPERSSTQLLGVLRFPRFDPLVDFARSNQPLLCRGMLSITKSKKTSNYLLYVYRVGPQEQGCHNLFAFIENFYTSET